MALLGTRLKHAWNAFASKDEQRKREPYTEYYGPSMSGWRPDKPRFSYASSKSIISSIYTRLAIDIASIDIRHIRRDDQNRYLEEIDSGLNNCLVVEANVDQAARAFRQDIIMTLFDEGCCALVPVDTSISPERSGGFDILTMRVGKVVTWYPRHVRLSVYNESIGDRQEITLPKSAVAIIENPMYSVMNEPSSTLKRLLHKINLLDQTDDNIASGKLDLILQLPYIVKSDTKRQQAEQRRKDVEAQLAGSKYGVAYTDGTEKITQLNRSVENNLVEQIKDLTAQLYVELGLTPEIMNGTADEKAMLNYWNRTIEPVLTAIVEAMRRTFLTKTARSQKQWIEFFRDPFRLVPIEQIAEISDVFARNEIATSNEIRQVIGWKPAEDPKADELVNSNMPQPGEEAPAADPAETMGPAFDEIDAALDDALSEFGVDSEVPDENA